MLKAHKDILELIRNEMARFRSGKTDHLSTVYELEDKFGYGRSQIERALAKDQGLSGERREIIRNKTERRVMNLIQQQMRDYEEGKIDQVDTNSDLAEKLGCNESTISAHLSQHPEVSQRKKSIVQRNVMLKSGRAFRRNEYSIPDNCQGHAWFLGALAGDGSSSYGDNTQNGAIRLSVTSKEFRDKFAETAKTLFGLEAKLREEKLSEENPNWKDTYQCSIYSRGLVEHLGDFRSEFWPETIKTRHRWVELDTDFTWAFLAGYFDSEGSISNPENSRNHRARFAVAYKKAAEYVTTLLQNVGVNGKIEKDKNKREGISSVSIGKIGQIKYFAENVSSCIPEKEKRLALYRQAEIAECPAEIADAYNLVMDLRAQTGLGARRLAQHPDLQGLNIPYTTINNWIHGNNPLRRAPEMKLAG
jgi:hypothetical protein